MKIPNLNNPAEGRGVFKVPQGYFDDLNKRIMQSVAEADKAAAAQADKSAAAQAGKTAASEAGKPAALEADRPAENKQPVKFWKTELYAKLKPYIYMAAMFGGLYFGVWVYKYQQRLLQEKAVAAQTAKENSTLDANATDEEIYDYVNDACDYMMADHHDIVACVTGAE
jgi:hypothetical protein